MRFLYVIALVLAGCAIGGKGCGGCVDSTTLSGCKEMCAPNHVRSMAGADCECDTGRRGDGGV